MPWSRRSIVQLTCELALAELGPGERAVDGAARLLGRGRQRDALVELHLDIRAEQALDLHGALGREDMRRAVDVRLKGDAGVGDLAQLRQAHDLEAARVRDDGALPAHEMVQAAQSGDALRTRPQHQVIGVGEDDVGAGRLELLGVEGLHGGGCPHRHEGRRADWPTRCRDLAQPRAAVGLQ